MKDLIKSIKRYHRPEKGFVSFNPVCMSEDVDEVENNLRECVKALIESVIQNIHNDYDTLERMSELKGYSPEEISNMVKDFNSYHVKIIEKVTGKKWEEVRDG